jgi:hypothetical protein
MPTPRLFPTRSGTHNEYEVIANAQIIGRIALLYDRSKPWFWVISLPFGAHRAGEATHVAPLVSRPG